jgi:3-oxoacyl-[acyl-carrier-protein] synthase II
MSYAMGSQKLVNKRVVVSGVGIISSLGANVEEFWNNCLRMKSTVEHIPDNWREYHQFSSTIWSPLPKLDLEQYGISQNESLRLDRATQLAIACCSMALEDAGIETEVRDNTKGIYLKNTDPLKTAVVFGTGAGGVTSFFSSHANHILSKTKMALSDLLAKATNNVDLDEVAKVHAEMEVPKRYNPFVVSMGMPNAVSGSISLKFGIAGPSVTLCSACASGTVALGHAYRAIKSGVADIVLSGGTEYLGDESGSIFRGFDVVGTLAKANGDRYKACRPFDKQRSGFLFCEGSAAALIVEERDHALARGANIIGEIVGFAETCDACNIMCIDSNSANVRKAILSALEEAALPANELDYLNTHGTGTVVNDEAEAALVADIFGKRPLVNSTKSILGHSIGASGAIEAIVTLLSIKNHITHACNNLEEPISDINFVTEIKEHEIRNGLSQSFGFGGHNAALVFREDHGS